MSLSTRVTPQVRERLAAEAAGRGVPLATYTRELLSGPPRLADEDGPDPVQNEVRCLFTGMPPATGIYREVCLALARTVEAGGTAGVTAGRELLSTVDTVERLFVPEVDEDEDEDGLP